ncbi:LacI family DNA-binding transcriptional regulator [Pseudoduganella lutea]|uniref:LacI family transcriptional regulator n=1 Tax=Pseudoduganella lutea TaxID=321985 RepID=A0A4P6KXT3_9BURK|nr:LacI family DNA-binding transcriptional regulator [Pseudoduganella lutea]QBE63545.1 LacI family transcriptional regulator [Pseudoduganella lutea]
MTKEWMGKMGTTLVDVAEAAGVSTMTASRAFSGAGYVAEEVKAKVLEAAASLGYSPDAAARMRKSGRTNVVGFVVTDMTSTVINEFVAEMGAVVHEHHMDLLIYNTFGELDVDGGKRISELLDSLWDGLVFVTPRMTEPYLQTLEKSDTPVVLVNYCARETSLPVVIGDNVNCSRDAVTHLIDLGHRRIGFIRGTPYSGQSAERERGYRLALEQAGIVADERLVGQGEFNEHTGFEAARLLLAQPDRPTAIFAANDAMAIGCMRAAREAGLKLPDQLSLVGFDDMAGAGMLQPGLTTLRHPAPEMARAAVGELIRRIHNEPGKRQRMTFPGELVIRASTAPPDVATPGKERARRPRKSAA